MPPSWLTSMQDELDQKPRLARFRDQHPGVLVREGSGFWQAVIPAQRRDGDHLLRAAGTARQTRRDLPGRQRRPARATLETGRAGLAQGQAG